MMYYFTKLDSNRLWQLEKKIKRGKDWCQKLDPEIVTEMLGSLIDDPTQQLNDFFALDFKALVYECNGLKKAADRKAFIEPYKPLLEAVKKAAKKILDFTWRLVVPKCN